MATGDSPESANHDNPRTTERCDYLAWNSDLDKLAKRRVMGHKAGDDVFARVYTLDHPSIAPLAAVASAVQADIELKVPTLLVATEERVSWGADNPLRQRSGHINAVLAEAGWQIEPGDSSNPWCDTARVMAELGVAATTAKRWMRDQVVPPPSTPRCSATLGVAPGSSTCLKSGTDWRHVCCSGTSPKKSGLVTTRRGTP